MAEITAKESKEIWDALVEERWKNCPEHHEYQRERLLQVKFGKGGQIQTRGELAVREDAGAFALRHFRGLVHIYRERIKARREEQKGGQHELFT